MEPIAVAEAFSGHAFEDVFHALADNVRWVSPGESTVEGKAAVIETCRAASAEIAELEKTEFIRFVSCATDRVAAVDAIGRYVSRDGSVSVVSSADIYEFDEAGKVTLITSYVVEMLPQRGPGWLEPDPDMSTEPQE